MLWLSQYILLAVTSTKIKAICSSASLICYLKNVNLTVSRINEMIAFIIVYAQVHEVDFSVVQNIASWLLHSACLTVIWSYKSIYIIFMHIHTQSYKDLLCLLFGQWGCYQTVFEFCWSICHAVEEYSVHNIFIVGSGRTQILVWGGPKWKDYKFD